MGADRVVQLKEVAEIMLPNQWSVAAVRRKPTGPIAWYPKPEAIELPWLLVVFKENPPDEEGHQEGRENRSPEGS